MPIRGDDVYAIAIPRFTLSVALDTQGSGNALGETHKTPKAQQLAATNPLRFKYGRTGGRKRWLDLDPQQGNVCLADGI